MMKILIFTVLMIFLIIPQIAYGSEILAEPKKSLFGPNDWIQIYVEVEEYSGGDVVWGVTQPDGIVIDGFLPSLQASKTTHLIIRDAFDGQFGTWQIHYEYNDAVKTINVEVEPLVVSITTDRLSYLPGSTIIAKFSTNYYNPIAASSETLTSNILNDDGFSVLPTDEIKTKMYQPVIVQHFSADELLDKNSFGIFHLVATYYNISVDAPFEIVNPDSSTSIFLSSNKEFYLPTDPVELNIVMPNINADSGILSITSPSGKLFTKTVSITNSLTRVILDDIDTSDVGVYLLQFEYNNNSNIGSFEVLEITKENSVKSNIEITLNKSQYRPGESIQATISTDKLVDAQIIYWFMDSSGKQSSQFSFVSPTSGTFTIPHVLSTDFIQGHSKLHVKYGSSETFALFFVSGNAMTPEEIKVTEYAGPEILLTIDEKNVNFSEIADLSISPNLELFVVDSGDKKIKVFDNSGNLVKTWGTIGSGEGELTNPQAILAEKSYVHVSDIGNSKIITFDNDGNFIRDWGNSGFEYQLVQNPTDIAVDGNGIYYISDGNQNRILKFDATGNYVGEINEFLTASAKFSSIESITTNGDNDIFLLSTKNNRILHFLDNGAFSKSFGTSGESNKQFQDPVSLEFSNEHLYVADSGNDRVIVINTTGDYITKWGTFGNGPGEFNHMTGIDVDLNGEIWVADSSNRIQKFAAISDVSQIKEIVPEWIKNNAKWWADGSIDDNSFKQGISFMIKEKIIAISDLPAASASEDSIPSWIKQNAKWWVDGVISEDEFVNGLKYMVEKGIISVS